MSFSRRLAFGPCILGLAVAAAKRRASSGSSSAMFSSVDRDLTSVPLVHGDVVIWGGPYLLRYHGVLALKQRHHSRLGSQRSNLTLRRAR
jgi:hypothetical protein